ncbi:MAG: Cys-Gln thioester bond-forming surface protein, partial [Ignavibacteriae bacterium]|nr:Cys-Gln thioester bond-forming surface protein [Ignavibacteriota bacterium]
MKNKLTAILAVFILLFMVSMTGFSEERGITVVSLTGTGSGTNISFTSPYSPYGTMSVFSGIINGVIDGGETSAFYCYDIRNYLVWTESYNDSSYTVNYVNYILLNHMPYLTYPYTGSAASANIEAAAVQCAIWHFSDGVDPTTISDAAVKTRALAIIADAESHSGLPVSFKNIEIVPVSVLHDPLIPETLKVKVVDELGVGVPGVTVILSTTTGTLSAATLTTGAGGFTPNFTLTKGSSSFSRVSARADHIVLSPGTIFVHYSSPSLKQKVTLAQAKHGNKIDYCDLTWNPPGGGGGGGLESSYDLGELLLQRYMKIRSGQTTKMLAVTNFMFSPNYLLKDIIPLNGPFNSNAVETTPFDILGISNATSAYACDYMVSANRVGAVFATTTNPPDVYNHTKATCDRYSKYELMDIKGVNANGRDFYM